MNAHARFLWRPWAPKSGMVRKKHLGSVVLVLIALMACRKDAPDPDHLHLVGSDGSRVVFDLDSVPYSTLSHYQFFSGDMKNLHPAEGVLPFEPITPLFTDYAKKSRFVWMPPGVQATYNSDGTVLDFPNGAVLIKNFYYEHVQPEGDRRVIETRLLIRKNDAWVFADYIWNETQTEAHYNMDGGSTSLIWLDDNAEFRCVSYEIPEASECHTCHKLYDIDTPIGTKPQSLNSTFNYPDGPMNQLAKWEQVGYLASGYPQNINTVVPWTDENQDLNSRVRAYLDMNCAHCHSTGRHCDYRPMRFAWNETIDPSNLGVCVLTEDLIEPTQTRIAFSGHPAKSMMYYRLNSTDLAVRMPLLGRTLIHDEAVDLVDQWIQQLEPPCQ